jgi:integrase
LPLTSEAEAIFREVKVDGVGPQDLVFLSRRNTLNKAVPVSVRDSFASALRKAGIKKFRWHDLRHTAASYLAMAGASQAELMAILGHRSPIMTKRYVHFTQKHLADLMGRTSKQMIVTEIKDDYSSTASPNTYPLRVDEESGDGSRDSSPPS